MGGGSCREVVVVWQPVHLEREMTIGARAWVAEHLSTSHLNDSHDPAGTLFYRSSLSLRPAGGGDDDSYGLYEHSNRRIQ